MVAQQDTSPSRGETREPPTPVARRPARPLPFASGPGPLLLAKLFGFSARKQARFFFSFFFEEEKL